MSMDEGIIGGNALDNTATVAYLDEDYVTNVYGGDNKYDALNQIESNSKNSVSAASDSSAKKGGTVDGISISKASSVSVQNFEDGTQVTTISCGAVTGMPSASNEVSMDNLMNLVNGRNKIDSILDKMEEDMETAETTMEDIETEYAESEKEIEQLETDLDAKEAEVKTAQQETKAAKSDYNKT